MMTPGGPGWNDPPSLSYETHTQTTSRRNLLTKRVGLPNLTVPNEPGAPSPLTREGLPPTAKKELPPPPKMKTLSKPPAESISSPSDQSRTTKNMAESQNPSAADINEPSSSSSSSGENQATSHKPATEEVTIFNPSEVEIKENTADHPKKVEDELNESDIESINIDVVTDLKALAERCHDNKVISTQVKNTILKKIEILEKQINEKKLPTPVTQKLETLTKFLVLKKYDKAWDSHLALVCDHSSSVMQWMVGVKKLITEAKKLNLQ